MTLNCQLPVDPEGGGAVGEYGGGGEVYSEAIAQYPAKACNVIIYIETNAIQLPTYIDSYWLVIY